MRTLAEHRAAVLSLVAPLPATTVPVGSALGLVLAHDRALTIWRDPRTATRSQYWMLLVMVTYTCLGLWLLSAVSQ